MLQSVHVRLEQASGMDAGPTEGPPLALSYINLSEEGERFSIASGIFNDLFGE